MERNHKEKGLTGAKGVVRPLELLAGSVVLALGGNALEVVSVVLEAAYRIFIIKEEIIKLVPGLEIKEERRTSVSSGSCSGNELFGEVTLTNQLRYSTGIRETKPGHGTMEDWR